MKKYAKILAFFLFISGTFASYSLAQNTTENFCQRHAELIG